MFEPCSQHCDCQECQFRRAFTTVNKEWNRGLLTEYELAERLFLVSADFLYSQRQGGPTGEVFEVRRHMISPHKTNPDYPLLPGDILVRQGDGSFMKTAPGLGMSGFVLKPFQLASLRRLEQHPRIVFC